MKINFEGSVEEFRAIFFGATSIEFEFDEEGVSEAFTSPEAFTPSGESEPATFDVVEGGQSGHEPGPEPIQLPLSDQVYLQPQDAFLAEPEPSNTSHPHNEMPEPKNDPRVGQSLNLPRLKPEDRSAGWEKFKETVFLWLQGFGETHEVEVDRKIPLRYKKGKKKGRIKTDHRGKARHETVRVVEVQPVPQPDRLQAIRDLGQGRFPKPVLVMAYEIGSLQRMVQNALVEGGHSDTSLEFADQIAMNMVQVCHIGFPDLAGTYDYSTKWKRGAVNA